jgi:signal transduction histidine kinase
LYSTFAYGWPGAGLLLMRVVAGIALVDRGMARSKAGLREEVYRIGREAIINACRHSQARSIEIEAEYRPTELRISVLDNGCGIDPEQMQWGRNGPWGLQGMRERAEQIGARLRLCSSVQVGTEIELRVPARIAFDCSAGRMTS